MCYHCHAEGSGVPRARRCESVRKLVRRARRHRRRKDHHGRAAVGAGEFLEREGRRGGVFEYRIDFGPGYRVYFGKDGDALVILLGGGTKKRQDRDIATAQMRWKDYKKRKSQET
jgi:putative addiction module killer protein